MGKKRHKNCRDVDGVLLLNKPVGWGSNAALQYVKRIYHACKAGHTGSLDPLASGMLPICFGEATKISGFLLDADKHYRVSCRLGEKTDTGDADGRLIERQPVPECNSMKVRKVLEGFHGDLQQVPPMYSAIKHKGRRLYELARDGHTVEREARKIHIDALELNRFEGQELDLTMRCSKGTYVRTLVEDIANALDTCGHVVSLHRDGVGPYRGEAMIAMEELEQRGDDFLSLDELLLPIDSAVADWPTVEVGRDAAYYLQQGQSVQIPLAPRRGRVRLYGVDERFIGIGEIQLDGRVAPKRLIRRPSSGIG